MKKWSAVTCVGFAAQRPVNNTEKYANFENVCSDFFTDRFDGILQPGLSWVS